MKESRNVKPGKIPCLCLDICEFGKCPKQKRKNLLIELQKKLEETLGMGKFTIDSSYTHSVRRHGTGDGYYLLFTEYTPKKAFKYALDFCRKLDGKSHLKIRAVLGIGNIEIIGDQYFGDVLIELKRLVDERKVKKFMEDTDARYVLAITHTCFLELIKYSKSIISDFKGLSYEDKHGQKFKGHIYIDGVDYKQLEAPAKQIFGKNIDVVTFKTYEEAAQNYAAKILPISLANCAERRRLIELGRRIDQKIEIARRGGALADLILSDDPDRW